LLVYCPDDDEYLRVINGAFHQLTKWTSHERDSEKRAAAVATTWRAAYDLTMECGWQQDIIMTCTNEEFQNLIDAVLLVATNINNGLNAIVSQQETANINLALIKQAIQALELAVQVSGDSSNITNILDGCLDCGDIVTTLPDPLPPFDPDLPPIGGDAEGYAAYICDAATYVYDIHLLGGYANLVLYEGGLASIGAAGVIAILIASGIGMPLVIIIAIIELIIAIIAGGTSQSINDELEAARDDIICAIYLSDGSNEAIGAIYQTMASLGMSQTAQDVLAAFINVSVVNDIFAGNVTVSDLFVGSDCSTCEVTGVPLPINIDTCQQQEGWGTKTTCDGIIHPSSMFDAGFDCDTQTEDIGFEGEDGLRTGGNNNENLPDSTVGMLITPSISGQVTIELSRLSTFSSGLTIHVIEVVGNNTVHTQQVASVSGWQETTIAYTLQADIAYKIRFIPNNVYSWRLRRGYFT